MAIPWAFRKMEQVADEETPPPTLEDSPENKIERDELTERRLREALEEETQDLEGRRPPGTKPEHDH